MFEASFNAALRDYQNLLSTLGESNLTVPNLNLDTGEGTLPGRYFMADDAYAHLLVQLISNRSGPISPLLRADILAHFAGISSWGPRRRDRLDKTRVDWARVPQALDALRVLPQLSDVAVRFGNRLARAY